MLLVVWNILLPVNSAISYIYIYIYLFLHLLCLRHSIPCNGFSYELSLCSSCMYFVFLVVVNMVRKRRTEVPGEGQSSGSQEPSGRGAGGQQQQPPFQQQQQQQGGGYHAGGGRGGWTPQRGGYGGHRGGGGNPRGGMPPQQYYGGPPSEYQQGRGPQQYQRGGGAPQRRTGGPRGPPGGPSRQPVPELHQATQAPYQAGVTTQTMPYGSPAESHGEAGPSSRAPEPAPSTVIQQFQQMTLQTEVAPSQAIQPASSKSMRFPLRPGKGSTGTRCIVKANHFFAELPDKDLHQYDVSFYFFIFPHLLYTVTPWFFLSLTSWWFIFFS